MKFELSPAEIEQYNEWHHHGCDAEAGAIGGRISFEFTPTGLGMITEVKCLCGKTLNLTDFEAW